MPDNREEIAKSISCYGLPYGTWGLACWLFASVTTFLTYARPPKRQDMPLFIAKIVMTVGPVIFTCIRCHGEWVFVLIACGKLAPWALKMLNDRITLRFKKRSTLLAVKGLFQYSANPAEEKQLDEYDSDDGDTTNETVTKAVNTILAVCAVLTIIILCIGGWVALVKFVLIVSPPKYNDSVNVASAWISVIIASIIFIIVLFCVSFCLCSCMNKISECFGSSGDIASIVVVYFVVASHVLFSHILLADLYKNWNGLASEKYARISAIIFLVGRNLHIIDFIQYLYESYRNR
ncbi:13290_t:CDS:2 [Ambispora gerdemannii]|uniref:13290_t:CDS:1 n=1 Tax=Ambispora gerdemannii TaxID=144530 RepID=A0A9N9DTT5_9GLOM|nr:13290_t:CDS:2 [Ambispora gerdemannii]